MSGEIRSFMEIAPMTGEAKIRLIILTTMLFGDHMLNVEGNQWQFVLVASAVFAAVCSTNSHESP